MRVGFRCVLTVLVAIAVFSIVNSAQVTTDPARSELQLEFADLLFSDERYWEAIPAYERAKQNASSEQLVRSVKGLLSSLLSVAEFGRAYQEAQLLLKLRPSDAETRALYADGFWSSGLFEEAESMYRNILSDAPESIDARDGLARSLATRNKLNAARNEALAAIAQDPNRAKSYHTLGTIYRRLHRYQDAADAYDKWEVRLSRDRKSRRAQRIQNDVKFLRSFGDRVPFEIVEETVPKASSTDGRNVVLRTATHVHVIPFSLRDKKVVVRGKVNGYGPMDLVIDTGAEQMVLSEKTALDVGVKKITQTLSAGVGDVGIRSLDLGRVDSLEVGSLKIQNLPGIIKSPPLTGLPASRVTDSFSPLAVGLSMEVDYKNRQLIVARQLPDRPADIELPMRMNRLAVVRGVINQTHFKSFVVDTGGEELSISLTTANELNMTPVRHIPLKVYGTSGWDLDAFLLPGVDLAFKNIAYNNFPVVVLNLHRPSALLGFELGGIIGHSILSKYRVAFDMEDSVLRFTEF